MAKKANALKTRKKRGTIIQPQHGNDNEFPKTHSLLESLGSLQRSIGNREVERLFKAGIVQAKLTVGLPDDAQITLLKQRQEEPGISSALQGRIDGLKGGGRPLDASTRAYFEPRFGADFSRVRIHTGSEAAAYARILRAKAFTLGRHLFFAGGCPGLDSEKGRHLLAHELTHYLQQNRATGGGSTEDKIQRQPDRERGSYLISPMISEIHINLTPPQCVWLVWGNPGELYSPRRLANRRVWGGGSWSELMYFGPIICSSGAGKCEVDCNDASVSQREGSLCTPKGGCWLTNPDWIHRLSGAGIPYFVGFQRSGVAIHGDMAGGTPLLVDGLPHSHGCVRIPYGFAQMIYENIWPGYTAVCVYGSWWGHTCWRRGSEVNRTAPQTSLPWGIPV